MKTEYNFLELEGALMESVKPELKCGRVFGQVKVKEKAWEEFLEYVRSLEEDLELLRNFISIQRKIESLKKKEEFNFERYIKIKSEEGYDEEFERVRDKFLEKLTEKEEERC